MMTKDAPLCTLVALVLAVGLYYSIQDYLRQRYLLNSAQMVLVECKDLGVRLKSLRERNQQLVSIAPASYESGQDVADVLESCQISMPATGLKEFSTQVYEGLGVERVRVANPFDRPVELKQMVQFASRVNGLPIRFFVDRIAFEPAVVPSQQSESWNVTDLELSFLRQQQGGLD